MWLVFCLKISNSSLNPQGDFNAGDFNAGDFRLHLTIRI
jgi:hypothetical protein